MANEISRTTRISWSKNNASLIAQITEDMDQTGDQVIENIQTIGATSEAIDVNEITGACHVMFKNMEPDWATLSTAEKDSYSGSTTAQKRADFETKHAVYVSAVDPAVKTDKGVFKIVPGSGVSLTTTDTPEFYAIRDTNDVRLLVVAIEV